MQLFYQQNIQYISGTCPTIDHNKHNLSQATVEKLVNLEYYNRTLGTDQMKRLDETLKQTLISVTNELNKEIKELNGKTKRLFSVWTHFDQDYRGKRGIHEQTAIVDCVQMKESFKKIVDDLNRISRTLSMVDENGTCHCKCSSDVVVGTSTEITDLPIELTTFTLENINRTSSYGEKTKQLKKVILSEYKPQMIVSVVDMMNNKIKNITNKEIIDTATTADNGNRFTTVRVLEDNITTPKKPDMITEPKEDMSPAMSNAVTNLLNLNGHTRTIESQTPYNEVVTKDSEDLQLIISTSETPKTSTESTTITGDNIAITMIDYDVAYYSTVQEELISNKKVSSKLIADGEDNLQSTTTEIPNLDLNESINTTKKNLESMTENENISESTTEKSEFYKNENNNDVIKINLKSTELNDNSLKSTTETSSFDKDENEYKITTERYELTTINADFESNTKISYPNTNGSHVGLSSAKQNIKESTTQISVPNQSNKTVGLKERNFAEDQDKIDFNKSKDEKTINQPKTERNLVENKNDLKPHDHDVNNSPRSADTTQQVQPKWYPICFYPVPCSSPNILSHQQNVQDANQGTIHYSAQSLNTHKRIAPVANATVIQNNYPIISYCPVGMICPTTDFAGQTNMLHCMLKSTLSEIQLVHVNNKTDENTSNRTTKSNADDTKVLATMTGKNAREDRKEILTGKKLINRNDII